MCANNNPIYSSTCNYNTSCHAACSVKANDIETEDDVICTDAICDLCEHVTDVIEQVIIKNT